MGWPRTSGASAAASAGSDARCCASATRRSVRAGLAALALIAMAPAGALAADMPEMLRGSYSPTFTRWEGFYFGGQIGASWGSTDFGNATQSLVDYMLADTELQPIVSGWTSLPKGSTNSSSYGGFVGYNFQWDDVVLGGELNYNHVSIAMGAQDTIGPIQVPGANMPDGSSVYYTVTLQSAASVAIHDIATARARAGWTFDRFMPYAFGGLAVGLVDVSRSATLAGSTKTTTTTTTPPVITTVPLDLPRDPQSQVQNGLFAYGFTAGLGLEVALLQNVFVRGEWEFIEFPNISDMRVEVNSVRAAVGLKF